MAAAVKYIINQLSSVGSKSSEIQYSTTLFNLVVVIECYDRFINKYKTSSHRTRRYNI
jgi:hypothetical protein